MLIKSFIFVVMFFIAISLGISLLYLGKERGQTKRFAQTLALRIGFSVSLFIALLIAFAIHGLQPHWL